MEERIADLDEKFEEGMTNVVSDPEHSFEVGKLICKISDELQIEHSMAKGYLLQAYSGFFIGLHDRAFEYVNMALPIFIKYGDKKNQAASYNTLGFIYNYFDDHSKRLYFNLQSLKIRKEIGDEDGFMRSLNNTGDAYLSLGKNAEALTHFKKCLAIAKTSDQRMLSVVHSNIADSYYRMEQYTKAIKAIGFSNKFANEINFESILSCNILILGRIYNKRNEFKKSIELITKFLDENTTYIAEDIVDVYKELATAYENIGGAQQSLIALKKHYKLKDEIFKDKQKKDLKSLTFRKTINDLEDKTKTLESLVNIRTNELKGALESEKIITFFSRELNDTLTLSDALWKIAENVIAKLNLDDCVIYLVDHKNKNLIQKAAYGPKNIDYKRIYKPIEIPMGTGIVGNVALTGKHELITNTDDDHRYIVDDVKRKSELAVPIFYKKKVIGVIDSEHPELNFFNERHLYIFNMISSLLESHFSRLKEQEIKEVLQREIITLNNNLEKEIDHKSKENTELNHKILIQEKKVIIGEIAAIIAHEMNTPLASIKAGSEAILFLLNRIMEAQIERPISNEDLIFILPRIHPIGNEENNRRKNMRKRIQEIESKLNDLGKSFKHEVILLLTKLNITETEDLSALSKIKNPLNTLNLLYDINSIYGFNQSLIEMSKKTSTSIANLKSFVLNDEKKVKKSTQLNSTFYGLEQHVQLHYPEVLIEVDIDKEVSIMAYDFQTIQLWSNLTSLILDNAEFGSNPIISFTSFKKAKTFGIKINCQTLKIKKAIFDNDLLSKRFLDFEEHSTKLSLNIIKTILDDHNAHFQCITEGECINMTLSFNE
ncbi:MAG: tetratricopeptide repeat protein [Crocinitomicaceae bacterium]|nr:tetratricopeptide repeat protein [Crocinitomicaceae bacterium]